MCVLPFSMSLTAFRIISKYVFSVLIVICEGRGWIVYPFSLVLTNGWTKMFTNCFRQTRVLLSLHLR